jgi:hypothetical protein
VKLWLKINQWIIPATPLELDPQKFYLFDGWTQKSLKESPKSPTAFVVSPTSLLNITPKSLHLHFNSLPEWALKILEYKDAPTPINTS